MSVGILIVTHPGVGTSIRNSAQRILGCCSLYTKCLDVPHDAPVDRINQSIQQRLDELNTGKGVLVLTDIYGATPNNLVRAFSKKGQTAVIAGLNLPMLLRVFNYPDVELKELCTKAAEGGIKGIQMCSLENKGSS